MTDLGTQALIRQPLAAGRPLVAFDFDGTLTTHDSFTAFLRWHAGTGGWMRGLAAMTPDLLAYLGHKDRGRLKAASVKQFLAGMDRATLEAAAERFAALTHDGFIRPDALACWNDWGRRGAYRVIVTASPEITVAPFARRLGAEGLIGTHLAFDAKNRITGAFLGENCRAAEKVVRLRAAYGPETSLAAAYGDTTGDIEMLEIADDAGFRRFKQRP
jgi:phosphatidylglycerophosphatase C